MRARGALGLAALAVSGACASVGVDIEKVPICAAATTLQPLPAASACDAEALARHATALSDLLVKPMSQALVRIEFDEASRVRGVCVDAGVGSHAWHARRNAAAHLDDALALPAGPRCIAGRRFDLNRYAAKRAEIDESARWCSFVEGDRLTALAPCSKFPSDWILHHRIGASWPYLYLYLRIEGDEASSVPASDTLRRCERTEWGFEDRSECILSAGYQLLMSPEYELLTSPESGAEGTP